MQKFEHQLRTNQHAKSVQMIMTRTNNTFYKSNQSHKKLSTKGDTISSYLRKFEIDKQNLNLAKRIMQCQSQLSRDTYLKQWQKIKKIIKVRSQFKKTLHAKQPKIYKFQPILGKGSLRVDISYNNLKGFCSNPSNKNVYKILYMLGSTQVQPDKKLLTLDCLKSYSTSFYALQSFKKKKIICKILQISENNCYEAGHFQADLSQPGSHQVDVYNRLGKVISKINFDLKVQNKKHQKSKRKNIQKQNLPSIFREQSNQNFTKN